MHLADAFIQSDLQSIQVIHFLWVCVFPGNRTHNLCAANTMLYHWATCLLWCFISSGQHGSWRRSSPAVEANPLVLSGHVQGPDRPHAGAHAQPRGSSGGQEGGARVRPWAELLGDPQREPESWPWGEDAAVDMWTEMHFCFYMRRCDILLWLSYLCIQSKHSSHAHFLCWEEDRDISLRCCWYSK